MFWQNIFILVLCAARALVNGESLIHYPKGETLALSTRAIFGFISQACLYTSIHLISLSKAQTFYFTGPIYTGFLAYLAFKEKFTVIDIVGVILAFTGVLLINNPFEMDPSTEGVLLLGTILALVGGFCLSIA